jgi:hypothetical protein
MKHPATKETITRLLKEAGYVNENRRIQRARFCNDTGTNPCTFDKWINGQVAISLTTLESLAQKLSININIFYTP